MLFPVLFFCIILFSWFNSEDKQQWFIWMRLKLPFLLLPIAFFLFGDFSERLIRMLFRLFVGTMVVSMCVVLVRYSLHFQEINQSLLSGGRMPVPYSHIRYSLLLATAFFIGIWLYVNEGKQKYYLIILLFLFSSLHVISVRSGLLTLYVGVFFLLLYFLLLKNQWWIGLGGVMVVILLTTAAYKTIPSLQNRMAFMRYDFGQWKQGNIDGNSDAMRLASIVTGYQLWLQNKWLGVGAGDVADASKQMEKSLFPNIHDEASLKMPHNEILWTACVLGLLGVTMFVVAWVMPSIIFIQQLNWLYLTIQLVFFVSFMVEYTLEEQIGGTFFVLFQMLFYKWFSTQKWNPSQL